MAGLVTISLVQQTAGTRSIVEPIADFASAARLVHLSPQILETLYAQHSRFHPFVSELEFG